MRFICWLFIICLIAPVQSHAWFMTLGGGVEAEVGDCPGGTYSFYWDGNHSSGVYYACVDSGETSIAATTDNLTPSTAYGEDTGSYGVNLIDGASWDLISWSQTADQYVDGTDNALTACIRLNKPTDTASDQGLIYIEDASYKWQILRYIEGDEQLVTASDFNTYQDLTSTNAISIDTWTTVASSWNYDSGDADYQDLAVKIGANAWKDSVDTLDGQSSTGITGIAIVNYGDTSDIYVDKVIIMDGYQTACPW